VHFLKIQERSVSEVESDESDVEGSGTSNDNKVVVNIDERIRDPSTRTIKTLTTEVARTLKAQLPGYTQSDINQIAKRAVIASEKEKGKQWAEARRQKK
jgi:hypothetical protein